MSWRRIQSVARFEWGGAVLRPGYWFTTAVFSALMVGSLWLQATISYDATRAPDVALSVLVASDPRGARFALAAAFVLFASLPMLTAGSYFQTATQEERSTRTGEYLLAAARADEIVIGKYLGLGVAGLTQTAIWLAAAAASLHVTGGVSEEFLPSPGMLALLLGFLVTGFLLFGALTLLTACLGATEREGQQLFTASLLLGTLPVAFAIGRILNDPEGSIARILSWFPLTASLAMPLRVIANPDSVSRLEILAVVGLLVVATVGMLRIAPRLYRLSMVSAGVSLGFRALWRQARLDLHGSQDEGKPGRSGPG